MNHIAVPIVRLGAPGREAVRLAAVVATDKRPTRAYGVEVADIGQLAMAALGGAALPTAKRGDLPGPAYLLASTPHHARQLVQGRSCALGLALASLAHHCGLTPQRPVIATGNLTSTGAVGPVDYLEEKLAHIAASLQATAALDTLVLIPKQGLDAARLAALQRRIPGLTEVATLAEAAQLAMPNGTSFGNSRQASLRQELESLRYEHDRMAEMYASALELFALTQAMPHDSALARTLRYHAWMSAAFALQRTADVVPRPWPDAPATDAKGLAAYLGNKAAELAKDSAAKLPAELLAQHDNYKATEAFASLCFADGAMDAQRGLSRRGLLAEEHSEYRKLLGTKAQMLWRLGLRLFGHGEVRDGLRLVEEAVAAVEEALELAPKGDHCVERNDAARVRTYVCGALLARKAIIRKDEWDCCGDRERIDREARAVLGSVHPGGEGMPAQHPGWMLEQLYRLWWLEDDAQQIINHWQALPAHGDFGEPVHLALLRAANPQPCDLAVAALVLEAASRTGHDALARDIAEQVLTYFRTDVAAPREPTPLDLVRFAPLARASSQVSLPVWDGLERWKARSLSWSAMAAPTLASGLDALCCDPADPEVRRKLLLWLGVPA
jgi:hypothetical protein